MEYGGLFFFFRTIPGMFMMPLFILGYFVVGHTEPDYMAYEILAEEIYTVDGDDPRHSDLLRLPPGLKGFFDLAEAEAYANMVGKPLFISITGHGSVNCREMEARVWSSPEVLDILFNDYVIVALYVDERTELPEEEWIVTPSGETLKTLGRVNSVMVMERYGVYSQPTYILQGKDGKVLVPPRGYDLSVPAFIEFLESGIEAYNAR